MSTDIITTKFQDVSISISVFVVAGFFLNWAYSYSESLGVPMEITNMCGDAIRGSCERIYGRAALRPEDRSGE